MAIYYFTGTGNSLFVARKMGTLLGCQPIPITKTMDSSMIYTDAETIGIIFPSYLAPLYGVPLIVEEFMKRCKHLKNRHLFAVCTCGGYEIVNATPTLRNFSKLVKEIGLNLSAEYSVRLPMNNLDYEHIPVPIETDTVTIIKKAQLQIEDICNRIAHHQRGRHHYLRRFITIMMTPIYRILANSCMKSLKELACEPEDSTLYFKELIPLTDRSIRVDESCNGCRICTRVCPVQNIEFVNRKPIWLHKCEMCFACDEWCPSGAIHHWGRPNGVKYHHPEVRLKDMILR